MAVLGACTTLGWIPTEQYYCTVLRVLLRADMKNDVNGASVSLADCNG